ncbi:MAG: Tm-1-like ATP-binding domain-containing protein [Desulfomonilaceae bacterium]
MAKTIVIIGSLDTKGDQIQFLKDRIHARGHRALVMDVSMGSSSKFEGDITPREIASFAGKDITEITGSDDRLFKTDAMTAGARQKMLDLLAKDEIDGAVALGGATITLLGSRAMQVLPFGIPKVIATSAAMPVYISQWFEAMDILVMQIIMEFTGMNELLTHALGQVAGVISGIVEESRHPSSLRLPYPAIAITEIGFSPQCTRQVESLLEANQWNVFTFHAQGISDRAMDRLISQGFFNGVIDIVPAGVIEEMFGGNRAAGRERLDAVCESGIPMVLAPCCINLTGCGATRTNREKYASRPHIKIDELRAMTRFDDEELTAAAQIYAEKLNRAKGPVRFVVPLKGWSAIDREGTVLYNPEKDRIFVEKLREKLNPSIPIVEVPSNLEDMEFAQALVDNFAEIFNEQTTGVRGRKSAS